MFMERGLQLGQAWFQMVVFRRDDIGAKGADAIFETGGGHLGSVLQPERPYHTVFTVGFLDAQARNTRCAGPVARLLTSTPAK
jgi:hypothetical protein